MYVYVTVQGRINKKGKKVRFLNPSGSEKIGEKNAAAYAAERFVLQETFLKLIIRGL